MNEIEILRAQMALEHSHATAVANVCAGVFGSQEAAGATAAALAAFRAACVQYLVWVLARFEERDQSLAERLRSGREASAGAPDGLLAAVGEVAARQGTSREALALLEAAMAAEAREAWQEFTRFFNRAWSERRNALDELLRGLPRVADWRGVYAIDADSILEERARYASVVGRLPPGATLRLGQEPRAK